MQQSSNDLYNSSTNLYTSYSFRFCSFLLLVVAEVPCLQFIRSKSPGTPRIAAALPLLSANLLLPLLFDQQHEVISRCVASFLLAWLTNFKVLGLCINRGPLRRPLTFLQAATLLLLPVTLQHDSPVGRHSPAEVNGKRPHWQEPSNGSRPALPIKNVAWSVLLALTKFGVLGGCVYLLLQDLNVFLKEYIYAVALYSLLGSLMDGSASIISWLCSFELAPQFNQPYLSTSLSDFWGRRWNIVASSCLRFLIYEPISECRMVSGGKSIAASSRQRRLVGMLASFVSSGLVHEVLFVYISHKRPTGKWFVFFSTQGPLCIAEHLVKRWLKRNRVQLPPWAQILMTNAALLLFAHFFFFPPVVDHGVADHVTLTVYKSFAALIGS